MDMTLDRTLAFTALLELSGHGFRRLSLQDSADQISALLGDWYSETGGTGSLWDYTRRWLLFERSQARTDTLSSQIRRNQDQS